MRKPTRSFHRLRRLRLRAAFTLTETVIAIGVLAVVLTGFIAVFTPAAQGIRRSISSEQADRLTTTLENELATLRTGQSPATATTAFDKGFTWLLEGGSSDYKKAIFVYQYRGNPADIRNDGTPNPLPIISGEPGKDYIVQSMSRRLDDAKLEDDLKAIEGSVFFVKPTQLIYKPDPDDKNTPPKIILGLGDPGKIKNPEPLPVRVPPFPAEPTNANDYSEAVIAFSAEFHSVPTKTFAYLNGSTAFGKRFSDIVKLNSTVKPIFTRNLAVRR